MSQTERQEHSEGRAHAPEVAGRAEHRFRRYYMLPDAMIDVGVEGRGGIATTQQQHRRKDNSPVVQATPARRTIVFFDRNRLDSNRGQGCGQ